MNPPRSALPPGRSRRSAVLVASLAWLLCLNVANAAVDFRGSQFIGFTNFAGFTVSTQENHPARTLTSSELIAGFDWTELVLSWNVDAPPGTGLKFEAGPVRPGAPTRFYTLGYWSIDPARQPRQSVKNQRDDQGEVRTDTLVLREPARRFQIRLTFTGPDLQIQPVLRFLGVSLCTPQTQSPALPPNRRAWGKTLDVPKRSQLAYPEGEEWCSPASVSMVLAWWAHQLDRPALDLDVPRVADGVFDRQHGGTGNWSFNTAFAGSLPGLRAYVTRLTDVSELEDWTAAGLPVVISVDGGRLQGGTARGTGHLVVCVGFTPAGDVAINDPGTRHEIRRTVPRANLVAAWKHSHGTAYLIYPENRTPPRDRFGHWPNPAR